MTQDGRVVGVVLALVNVLAGAVAHEQLPGQFGIRFGVARPRWQAQLPAWARRLHRLCRSRPEAAGVFTDNLDLLPRY